MLHTGMSDCFQMTIHSSLLCIQLESFVFTFDCESVKRIFGSFASGSASKTVSYIYV